MAREAIILAVLAGMVLIPLSVSAGVFSNLTGRAVAADTVPNASFVATNSEKTSLVAANMGPAVVLGEAVKADMDPVITSAALAPSMGPIGNPAEADTVPDAGGYINVYTVHARDTVASVAAIFGVTPSTILYANDLKAGAQLTVGDTLVIPPFSGIVYTVAKGDTVSSIARKLGVDKQDIIFYNEITPDAALSVGDTLMIPDEDMSISQTKPATGTTPVKKPAAKPSLQKPSAGNYFIYPLPVDVSQWGRGLHGNCGCGIDIRAPKGTPIYAIADGTVLISKSGGYNAGWGSYVVINHVLPNGTPAQSLSAHMSRVVATVGQTVKAGDVIGYVGTTGHSTGPHLHIEIKGVSNPFVNPSYGR